MFLLSLENKKEVKAIAKHCGVARYFNEILGGPKSKIENFIHILKKHNIKPREALYVGDSHGDVKAAKQMKIKIILLGKKHLSKKLKEDLQADYVVSDLCQISKL